jgi:hypothetical protein
MGYAITFDYCMDIRLVIHTLYKCTLYLKKLGSPSLAVTGEWRDSKDSAREDAACRALPVLENDIKEE